MATKSTALDLALGLLKSKSHVTPDELNKHVGKGNYASKYVLYLKLAGHDIVTNKNGRSVVNYAYVGINPNVDTSVKASERRASTQLNGKSAVVVASKPAVAPKKAKSAPAEVKVDVKPNDQSVKIVSKTARKPVMTKEEIAHATKTLMEMRKKKGAVLNAPAIVAASSFNVDADWDTGVEDVRSLLR